MSVKHTVTLTREDAEKRWIERALEDRRKELALIVKHIGNGDLEDQLELWNDRDNTGDWGTGFENYRIED